MPVQTKKSKTICFEEPRNFEELEALGTMEERGLNIRALFEVCMESS